MKIIFILGNLDMYLRKRNLEQKVLNNKNKATVLYETPKCEMKTTKTIKKFLF